VNLMVIKLNLLYLTGIFKHGCKKLGQLGFEGREIIFEIRQFR